MVNLKAFVCHRRKSCQPSTSYIGDMISTVETVAKIKFHIAITVKYHNMNMPF